MFPADPANQQIRRGVASRVALALTLLGAAATCVRAQDAIPDVKGSWSGKGKSIVFGSHSHHPGSQTAVDPPRVRDLGV
jgi:hypothetical protein